VGLFFCWVGGGGWVGGVRMRFGAGGVGWGGGVGEGVFCCYACL